MKNEKSCYYSRINNSIVLGNALIERSWDITKYGIVSRSIYNKLANYKDLYSCDEPDFQYEGLTYNKYKKGSFIEYELLDIKQKYSHESIYTGENMEIVLHFIDNLHGVEIKNHFIVYENAPAIKTYSEIRSVNVPMGEFFGECRINSIDKITLASSSNIKSLEFFTRTDSTNDLVVEQPGKEGFDRGNILFVANNDKGYFILKESPCFTDQRKECNGNFQIKDGIINVLGTGIRPEEMLDTKFRKTYASIVGVFIGDKNDGVLCLKQFQNVAYKIDSKLHTYCMANPWGDRKCLMHMCEEFVIRELMACSKLGITHYQIDDGWQKGKAFKRMNNMENLEDDYWDIDTVKFPSGFSNIVKIAEKYGITLALWYAPNFNNLYINITKDINLLFSIYMEHGITIFKIDGVKLRNKDTEERIEFMLRSLRNLSNGKIYFNLDLTADPRSGYFMFLEYGNLFLENRYTDWSNYYPYLTLKNLWDLSLYVPTKRLQIEFLNLSRNKDKYDDKSALAPFNYTYDYIFAITMFACPLAWCEVSEIENIAIEKLNKLISVYNTHRNNIFSGDILPIGNRPNGYNFTGFLSHNHSSESGYILLFRENTNDENFSYKLDLLIQKSITVEQIFPVDKENDNDQIFSGVNTFVKGMIFEGTLNIKIEKINSFLLLKYNVINT